MSEWYDAIADDIEIDWDQKEVNVHVTSNDCGNVYVTIPFDQIERVHGEIKAREPECKHGELLSGCCNACSDSGIDPRKHIPQMLETS